MSEINVEIVSEDKAGAGKRGRIVRLKEYYKAPGDREVYGPVPEVACANTLCTLREARKVATIDMVGIAEDVRS